MRQPNPNVQPEHARELWDAARSSTGAERVVTVRCRLITPMFGGGVTPGEVDREMPIRASALRGQLRFWWRLLYGADREPSDLFAVESAMWGGISSKGPRTSRVTLQVRRAMNRGPGNLPASSVPSGAQGGVQLAPEDKLDLPAYALIPDPENKGRSLLKAGHNFDLVLRFTQTVTCQQRKEVLEALRWWASFAGVGARTRRGFGAVKAASDDVELAPVTAEEVRRRGGWMVSGQPESNAIKAWRDAVNMLQRFRQGPDVGRNPGQGNRPGRSRWPEPDVIRRAAGRHAPMHEPEHRARGLYPRAAFGLPIVFHFKDGEDPRDQVLNPVGHDRMASPLILRPWFDGRQYRPVALLLPGWKERLNVSVRLDPADAKAKTSAPAWPEDPDERKRLAAKIEPMRAQHATDPLTAFMHFFAENVAGGAR